MLNKLHLLRQNEKQGRLHAVQLRSEEALTHLKLSGRARNCPGRCCKPCSCLSRRNQTHHRQQAPPSPLRRHTCMGHGARSCELCPATAYMQCSCIVAARTWWLLPQVQQCPAPAPVQSSLRQAAGTPVPARTALQQQHTAAASTKIGGLVENADGCPQ
jgi:hypothetical protein